MSKRGIKNYYRVGISTVKPAGLTTLAALITSLKATGAAYISTGASYINNNTLVSIGLAKSAKLSYADDGDEDNNGDKQVKLSFSCNLEGIAADATYEALKTLASGRKYVYLINEETKAVKWAGALNMQFIDNSEGNTVEKITISGEETGELDTMYGNVILT